MSYDGEGTEMSNACMNCGAEVPVYPDDFRCGKCGSFDVACFERCVCGHLVGFKLEVPAFGVLDVYCHDCIRKVTGRW